MSDHAASKTRSDTEVSHKSRRWLNLRRKRFWVIALVLLYTLAGVFLAPVLVKDYTVKAIEEATGREATIGAVRFNPFTLSLQAEAFSIGDANGGALLSIDALLVNLQASTLLGKALTFREIQLDGAHVFFERFTPDDDSLTRLLADIERQGSNDVKDPASDAGELPRVLIGTLTLNECTALIRDHVGAETVEIPVQPISATFHELTTLPGIDGDQNVQMRLENGGLLTWQGDLQLQPFHSLGHLSLEDASLDAFTPYLNSTLPIDSFAATLTVRSDYAINVDKSGQLSISLSNLESRVGDVAASGLAPASEFLTFSELAVTGGELRYPANTLEVKSVRLVDPFIDAWIDENGNPGLAQLIPGGEESDAPWHVSVAKFEVENGHVAFDDRSMHPNLVLDVESLSLQLLDIDNRDQTAMPLSASFEMGSGGSAELEGSLMLLPEFSVNGNISAEGLPLKALQPYLEQSYAVIIEDGELTTSSEFSLTPARGLHLAGNLKVDNLAVHDTVENEKLLAWKQVFVDRYEVGGEEADLRISTVAFSEPFCRIHIRKDLSTNFSSVFIENDGEAGAQSGDASEFTFVLGNLAVDNGSMDFSDFSLPLPFATKMQGMNGTLSAVDSRSTEPSEIRLEGRVDDYGIARIHGVMNFLDPVARTSLSVEFRNLLMTNLSAYAAQFAGREIDEGILDLELEYVITDGILSGVNSAVLSDLVLGKKVDSPDAISLPLGLAVALLKDSKGVIDIKIPVEGDINHPEFKLHGVVRHAAASLLTRAVKAPFKVLGSLVGIESDDFGQFKFLGGRYDLAPPELEKVALLQEALTQRPDLIIEIPGTWNDAVDRPALQYDDLRTAAGEHLRQRYSQGIEAEEMFDEEILKIFEEIYAERFPGSTLDALRAQYTVPPPHQPGGAPVFDQTAYASALRRLLVDSQTVEESELRALADQRAQSIADALLANEALDPSRIRIIEATRGESKDGEWVALELGVTHD